MGLGDLFKGNENQALKNRVAELEAMLTPEMRNLDLLRQNLASVQQQVATASAERNRLQTELSNIQILIANARLNLVETNEMVLMQEFGLYEPKYSFATSEMYKERLDYIRKQQKELIKSNQAATGYSNWSVNNDPAAGKKLVADMQKLLLRAFNSECDEAISKVKFNNIDASQKRIYTSATAISKLGSIMGVSITNAYYDLKMQELFLAHEYQMKKEQEKEEARRQREELKEQEKIRKEIEEARQKIKKDRQHFEAALLHIKKQMDEATDPETLRDLLEKKTEYEAQIVHLQNEEKTIDYREANQKAGYVYIISNIGAFGENVYKIGMTRRRFPEERIDELGDASVPFKFDVHALIFAKDAPKLESALHHAFDSKRVNMVNNKKEFFRVSLDEIKKVVRENFDKTVEFVDIPDAEQYRQSKLMSR